MKLPEFSVSRPVLTTMVTLIVCVLGAVSLTRLQIDLLPQIELPTLTIRTEYPGASPEVMEQRVTQILEEIVATVPGVEELSSVSAEGSSSVTVRFGWGTNIDAAVVDVRARIEDELSELPDDIVRPRISKFDVGSFPVVLLGISSHLDPVELTTLIEEQVRYRFSQIPGVAQVDPWGEYQREVRVELDPSRLRALEIPLDSVLAAIEDANIDLPAGEIEQGKQSVTVRAPAQFDNIQQIADTTVTVREGAPVRIRQIASVKDTYRKLERIARIDGQRGIRIAIRKESNENTVEVAERVLATAEDLNRDLPQLRIVPVINQGNFIERSIANVAQSVVYGGGLAVLVLLFFLRSFRSTLVISLAIPISLVATFALLYFGGLTLNLMTLGGLALGVGMMVDNSIVVLENIYRRRDELGEDSTDAAVRGASEVGPAIIAATITTLVIFLPLVFVGGVTGVLFQELAQVIVFALVCSLIVSLSLVPMVAAKLLRPAAESPKNPGWVGRFSRASESLFTRLHEVYAGALEWALAHRLVTVLTALLLLGGSLLLLPFIGTEFLPPSDEGEVRISGEMPVGTRLDLVDRQTRRMESIVYPAVPEMTASVVSVGASGYRPADAAKGEIQLSLTPASQRLRSNLAIAEDLRQRLEGEIPGMEVRTRAPQGQFLLQRVLGGGEEGLTIEVRGFELPVLDELARRVEDSLQGVAGVTDLRLSREAGIPQEELTIDRDKAADLGLTPRHVAQALETALAGSDVGEFRVRGNSYRILVQLANAEKVPLSQLLDLKVTAPDGRRIALRNVVTNEPTTGPILIDRKDQQRLVTVQANVAERPLGTVARDVQARLAEIPRPVGYDLRVAGNYEEQQKAFHDLLLSLFLALALVYMVMAAQYESFRDPLVVMLSVPVAAIGVLVTLAATGTTLNVQSYIGCIMLGGIVVNNAILLVDQAARLMQEDKSAEEAVVEAGRRRLRPILMTTLTTLLALLPLALGIGEGADAQAPLARAVLGGLAGSTLITLILVPVAYCAAHPKRSARAAAAKRDPAEVA